MYKINVLKGVGCPDRLAISPGAWKSSVQVLAAIHVSQTNRKRPETTAIQQNTE
jgi:hypothetical protein